MMAAAQGMIGMALAAGQGVADPAAVPYGGAEKLLHTNPLAVAFPTGVADHPLMFDFATSHRRGQGDQCRAARAETGARLNC